MKPTFYIVFLLFMTACAFEDIYHNIPENEKPVYKNGDILIYKSNTGLYDTITVTGITDDFEISDKRYHYEYIRLSFIKSTSNKSLGSLEQKLNRIGLSWNGVYYDNELV